MTNSIKGFLKVYKETTSNFTFTKVFCDIFFEVNWGKVSGVILMKIKLKRIFLLSVFSHYMKFHGKLGRSSQTYKYLYIPVKPPYAVSKSYVKQIYTLLQKWSIPKTVSKKFDA